MSKPILDPAFWRGRMMEAREEHHAVYVCSAERWREVAEAHRRILTREVGAWDSVLDCGCGWGRLLTLMPTLWRGRYWGIDISPDFLAKARLLHPDRTFVEASLLDLPATTPRCDWAVLISVRVMVQRELGGDAWAAMETEIRKYAKKLLYLEYDPSDWSVE